MSYSQGWNAFAQKGGNAIVLASVSSRGSCSVGGAPEMREVGKR